VRSIATVVQIGHVRQRLRVVVMVVIRIRGLRRAKPSVFPDSVVSLILPIPSHSNQSFDESDPSRARLSPKLSRRDRLLLRAELELGGSRALLHALVHVLL